ncbi:MAG: S9 family peptidase, partial [Saprospiraceae bacterium]|nr:S9 family peptidase [Saprospiraceae bacterium]
MRFILSILPIWLLLSSCQDQGNSPREISTYTIEQFYNNKSVFASSFSPDEAKLLVTSDESGIYNMYEMDVATGDTKPLTSSTQESIFAISYFPQDERTLYQSDQGGNEISHIYLRDLDGTVQDLISDSLAKAQFVRWAHDEKSFFYTSTTRDPRFFDLYEMSLGDFTAKMVYQNDENLSVASISDDKNFLALIRNITTSKNELYLYDLAAQKLIQLSPPDVTATFSPQFFSNDNQFLYCLSDESGEFAALVRYDLSTMQQEPVFSTDWDVWYAYDSYKEKYRVIGINEDGKTTIKLIELATGTELDFPKFDQGEITSVSISKSEELMRFSVGSSKSPSDLYIYDFNTGQHHRLTTCLNSEINAQDLVDGEVVRFKSYDGLEIPSIYYKPHQASESNRVPALLWVHGGPGGQSRQTYFPLIQYLVNHGYAVMAINNRGSSGYGKTFFAMDDQKHGDGDLKDCIEAKNWLASQPYIDPGKIGIVGGSYGGYMVMAALAFAPEEFDVGVNIFGVTNWLRTLKSIPPYWESFREALYKEMGDPYTADSVRLHKISPLFHASNVVKPLMVLQGANDPRVLQVESDEIV